MMILKIVNLVRHHIPNPDTQNDRTSSHFKFKDWCELEGNCGLAVGLKEDLCIVYTSQQPVSVFMVCLLFLSDDRKGQYPAFD